MWLLPIGTTFRVLPLEEYRTAGVSLFFKKETVDLQPANVAFDEAERNQPEGVLGSKGDIAGSQQSLKHEDTPKSLVR